MARRNPCSSSCVLVGSYCKQVNNRDYSLDAALMTVVSERDNNSFLKEWHRRLSFCLAKVYLNTAARVDSSPLVFKDSWHPSSFLTATC